MKKCNKRYISVSAVGQHLESGACVYQSSNEGITALHSAAGDNRIEIARELIKHGALVNKPNSRIETPFDTAMERGNYEMAKLLLQHGAKVCFSRQ